MSSIKINFRSGSTAGSGWNNILNSDTGLINLVDSTGAATSWTMQYLALPSVSAGTLGQHPVAGNDAAWIDNAYAARSGHGMGSDTGVWAELQLIGPANTEVYVDVFGQRDSGRRTDWRVNGGAVVSTDNDPSVGHVHRFTATTSAAGELLLEFKTTAGSTSGYANAAQITVIPGPELTITGDLQPGASFTVNYANFEGVPVSPVTLTDSNSNSITVPVTISDNGDGTGTATGTMPALPASGTAQGLLFGNVTVELST